MRYGHLALASFHCECPSRRRDLRRQVLQDGVGSDLSGHRLRCRESRLDLIRGGDRGLLKMCERFQTHVGNLLWANVRILSHLRLHRGSNQLYVGQSTVCMSKIAPLSCLEAVMSADEWRVPPWRHDCKLWPYCTNERIFQNEI